MKIREECVQELRRIAEELREITGEEPYAGMILLKCISQARIAILHYEHYVDTAEEADKLIQFCKGKLQVAKRETRAGDAVHALWLTRTVIYSFLKNEVEGSNTGMT